MRCWGSGSSRGDVVAIQLPSNAEFLIAYFGVVLMGGVFCTMHMPYRAGEMQPLMRFARARAVICCQGDGKYDAPATMRTLQAEIPTLEHIIVAGGEAPEGCLAMAAMIDKRRPIRRRSRCAPRTPASSASRPGPRPRRRG